MGLATFYMPLLGFLVASFFIQGLEAISCPSHWFMFEDFCYGFFKEKLNWNDAESECNTYGMVGHLASILSKREMDYISSVITTKYEETFRIWIGLYRIKGRKARFRWMDGSVVEYVSWTPKQPSECKKKQNCVELYADEYKRWNDQFCEVKQPYLCKTIFK